MTIEKVHKMGPARTQAKVATPKASKAFSEVLSEKQAEMGPKSLEAPHSLVGKRANPFLKPTPPGASGTTPSVEIDALAMKEKSKGTPSISVGGRADRVPLKNTVGIQTSSHKIHKNLETYRPLIEKHAKLNNLDPNLLAALIKQESNFRPSVVSGSGAVGLTQLMPSTARSVGVKDPLNPEQNISGGARYLRQMLDRFKGNVELALAGYNAGPGAVERYGGIPPFRETQHYVRAVAGHYEQIRSTGTFAVGPSVFAKNKA